MLNLQLYNNNPHLNKHQHGVSSKWLNSSNQDIKWEIHTSHNRTQTLIKEPETLMCLKFLFRNMINTMKSSLKSLEMLLTILLTVKLHYTNMIRFLMTKLLISMPKL